MKAERTQQAKPDDLIEAIHASQEAAVDMAREITERIGNVAPGLWKGTIAEGFPSAQEIAEMAFELTHKVLEAQHEFVRKLLDSFASVGQTAETASGAKTGSKAEPTSH